MKYTDQDRARFRRRCHVGELSADEQTNCLLWDGPITEKGGRFTIRKQTRQAHRVAWEMEHGELEPTVELQRTCPEPRCVNPAHYRAKYPWPNANRQSARKLMQLIDERINQLRLTTGQVARERIEELESIRTQAERIFGARDGA